MPKRSKYYQRGYRDGYQASFDTDWQPGEMKEVYENGNEGEIAGQILENYQQAAGTIYYEGVSDSALDNYENGFYDGFSEGVEEQVESIEGRI